MVKPEDFLKQAVEFLASANDEIGYRLIIVQAYYSAYHAALRFETSLSPRSQAATHNFGVHEALIQRLERPNNELEYIVKISSKDIGAQLRILKPLREIASYELGESIRIDQAEAAVGAAKDIFSETAKSNRTA